MTNPKNHPLWEHFAEEAELEGIDMEHVDDWLPWWKMFLCGARAANPQFNLPEDHAQTTN